MAQVSGGTATGSVRISSSSGRVRVVGEDRPDVDVHGRSRVDHDGNQTTIESTGGRLEVRVPVGADVVVGTTSGRVEINGRLGHVAVVTESGRVTIEEAQSVDVRSESGRIGIGRVEHDCRARTVSGRIDAETCGAADVSTGSGRITLERASGPVRAHCVSGSIEIGMESAHDVDAENVSGRITVSLPHGVQAFQPDGSVGTAPPPVDCDCTVNVRSVSGRVNVSSR